MIKLYNKIKNAIQSAIPPKAEELDVSKLGLNLRFNSKSFGSAKYQFLEIKGTLGISDVRIQFEWTDEVQSGKNDNINWESFDTIVNSFASGSKIIVVLAGTPDWLKMASWLTKDHKPCEYFAEKWVKLVAERYKNNSNIIGYQIGGHLDIYKTYPEGYMDFISRAHRVIKDINPKLLVLNSPAPLVFYKEVNIDYNQKLIDAGILNYIDVFATNFFGDNYGCVKENGQVTKFLNSLNIPIVISEIAFPFVGQQLLAQRMIPLLYKNIKNLAKVYISEFSSAYPDVTGLKVLYNTINCSDLYQYLKKIHIDT